MAKKFFAKLSEAAEGQMTELVGAIDAAREARRLGGFKIAQS